MRIAFILANDLKNFAETFGDSQTLTAKEVYSHLQKQSIKQPREEVEKYFFSLFLNISSKSIQIFKMCVIIYYKDTKL